MYPAKFPPYLETTSNLYISNLIPFLPTVASFSFKINYLTHFLSAIHDFPKMHTDCPQTSSKITRFCPCLQPYDRSRTSRIFFTPHPEIAVNFHLKSCQRYTRNLSNFTALTLPHPSKSQTSPHTKNPRNRQSYRDLSEYIKYLYLLRAWATSTAHATVHPTIGLLPIPRKPIISTCAGTDEEPANCASLCIRPMVSVIP